MALLNCLVYKLLLFYQQLQGKAAFAFHIQYGLLLKQFLTLLDTWAVICKKVASMWGMPGSMGFVFHLHGFVKSLTSMIWLSTSTG